MTSVSRRVLALGITVACSLALSSVARAAVFNVNSVADEIDDNLNDGNCHAAVANACTLRAAVMQAVVELEEDIAIALPAGVYALDKGTLDLSNDELSVPIITISGAGAGRTIIDAGGASSLLRVESGRTVEIFGITMRNGLSPIAGGISNGGTLTLSECTVSGNTASSGSGGGVFNSGSLLLRRTTISGNNASLKGGGIYAYAAGTIEIFESTLSDNGATDGGGISNSGTLYLVNSTVSQNHADNYGGGFYNDGTAWTYNATIAFNEADANGGVDGWGGGVYNLGTFNPRNSVIAGNYRPGFDDDCVGALGTFGWNRFGVLTNCTLTHAGACGGDDTEEPLLAELGPLQFNGGPTRTHAIALGSGLINGVQAPCICQYGSELTVDQRGGSRAIVSPCDIGAFERGALASDLIFADGFDTANLWAWK